MLFFKVNYKKCTDEELIAYLKEGKEKAFEEIYDRYKKKVYYYFYKMLHSDSEKAEDFLHDLFLKIIEKPHLYANGNKFSTWIYTIASNMCKNEYRRASIRKETKATEIINNVKEEESYFDSLDNSFIEKRLLEEISLLDEECKEIILLRFHEGLSIKEISEIMNCPEGTVKSRIFYSIQKLSKKLKVYQS